MTETQGHTNCTVCKCGTETVVGMLLQGCNVIYRAASGQLKIQFVKFITSFSTATIYKYSHFKFAIAQAITLGYHFCQQAKIDDIHKEHRREMDHLKRQSEKEKERLLQKMRDMREEIISKKVSLNKRITERSINLSA